MVSGNSRRLGSGLYNSLSKSSDIIFYLKNSGTFHDGFYSIFHLMVRRMCDRVSSDEKQVPSW